MKDGIGGGMDVIAAVVTAVRLACFDFVMRGHFFAFLTEDAVWIKVFH